MDKTEQIKLLEKKRNEMVEKKKIFKSSIDLIYKLSVEEKLDSDYSKGILMVDNNILYYLNLYNMSTRREIDKDWVEAILEEFEDNSKKDLEKIKLWEKGKQYLYEAIDEWKNYLEEYFKLYLPLVETPTRVEKILSIVTSAIKLAFSKKAQAENEFFKAWNGFKNNNFNK